MLTAAALVGLGSGALELGRSYVIERHQFDVPIGSFQSVQHGLADVAVALDGAQLLARKAAWAFDSDARRSPAELAAMAFLFAAEQARRASERALHFHGGYGFMEEYDVAALLPAGQGLGPACSTSPDREYARLADLRYGPVAARRRRPGALTWTSPRRSTAERFRRRGARADRGARSPTNVRQRAHDTGTMHDWGLHRAMADRGWIEQALPESLGGGGRGPEELAALFQRARARRRARTTA